MYVSSAQFTRKFYGVQAGLGKGDLVEFSYQQGKIVITPKLVIDRSQFPTADDEYTPAQRRVIDARLENSDEDIKHNRVHGPFETHQEFIRALRKEATKPARKNIKSPTR